jgi:hypothetical protein
VWSEPRARALGQIWQRTGLVLVLLFCCRSAWAEQDPAVCISTHADAQVLVRAGQLLQARQRFEACAIPDCPQLIQKDCKNLGKAVDKSIPTLRLSLREPDGNVVNGFEVEIDGVALALSASESSIEVNPGEHRLRLTAVSFPPAEVSVPVRRGEKDQRVIVQLAPRDPASRKVRSLGQILTGVGALGLVTFISFGVSAHLDKDALGDRATRPESERDYQLAERMHQKSVVADISLGVGLVSLGVATYLLYVTRNSVGDVAKKPLVGFDVRGSSNGAAAFLGGVF